MNMDFSANKRPVKVIREGAFGQTYFRNIYSVVNGKWYRKSWNEFDELKDIDQKYHRSNYYVSFNKYGVKCGTSLRFLKNNGWINSIDPYGWFQWYFRYWLGIRSLVDERQINRWKGIVSRFKDKLVRMIKDVNGKLDDYSNSPKITQILLYWGCELLESNLLWFFFFFLMKINYYWFNRQELLQKAKDKYHNGGGNNGGIILKKILKEKAG